jgi:hypothetical protein
MKEGDRINMKSGGCTFTSTGHPNEFVVEGIFIGVDDKEYKIYYKGIIARKYGN